MFFFLILNNIFLPYKFLFFLQNDKLKNTPEKKEQEETTARDLINTDTSKMSEPEFRITIIRILAGVKNRLESLSVEIKEVKSSHDEI